MRVLLVLAISALMGAFFTGEAMALTTVGESANAENAPRKPVTVEQFIYQTWLRPHNSLIPPEAITALGRWYGDAITPELVLTICAAETSLGDPKLGGRLVGVNNFGCIRSGSPNTPWGQLASGVVTVAGKKWWAWPDPWTGMAALGRLLKTGPGRQPGLYLKLITAKDWPAFTALYYGSSVPGYVDYHKRWVRFYEVFKGRLEAARKQGVIG